MKKFPVPKDYKYSDRHEWVRINSDGNYLVGLTPFALDLLGEIVYFELPQEDESFAANDPIGVVEAVKAATDIYTPISGTISRVNENLLSDPKLIEGSAYDEGWMFEIVPDDNTQSDYNALMDADKYDASINN